MGKIWPSEGEIIKSYSTIMTKLQKIERNFWNTIFFYAHNKKKHTHTHTHTHAHVYIYIYMYVYIYIVYIYIHTHIHTYIYIYKLFYIHNMFWLWQFSILNVNYHTRNWKILLIILRGFLLLNRENYIQLTCFGDYLM